MMRHASRPGCWPAGKLLVRVHTRSRSLLGRTRRKRSKNTCCISDDTDCCCFRSFHSTQFNGLCRRGANTFDHVSTVCFAAGESLRVERTQILSQWRTKGSPLATWEPPLRHLCPRLLHTLFCAKLPCSGSAEVGETDTSGQAEFVVRTLPRKFSPSITESQERHLQVDGHMVSAPSHIGFALSSAERCHQQNLQEAHPCPCSTVSVSSCQPVVSAASQLLHCAHSGVARIAFDVGFGHQFHSPLCSCASCNNRMCYCCSSF